MSPPMSLVNLMSLPVSQAHAERAKRVTARINGSGGVRNRPK